MPSSHNVKESQDNCSCNAIPRKFIFFACVAVFPHFEGYKKGKLYEIYHATYDDNCSTRIVLSI